MTASFAIFRSSCPVCCAFIAQRLEDRDQLDDLSIMRVYERCFTLDRISTSRRRFDAGLIV
jgi:hypothetical protein